MKKRGDAPASPNRMLATVIEKKCEVERTTTYAEMLDRTNDHELLTRTAEEEKEADEKLNRVAKNIVNPAAVTT